MFMSACVLVFICYLPFPVIVLACKSRGHDGVLEATTFVLRVLTHIALEYSRQHTFFLEVLLSKNELQLSV